jgi:hypothetical protein
MFVRKIGNLFAKGLTVPPASVRDARNKLHTLVIDHMGMGVPVIEGRAPLRAGKSRRPAILGKENRQLSDRELDIHLDEMMTNLVKEVSNWPSGRQPFQGVTIVIHGGNETPTKTVAESNDLIPLMLSEGYYPIFIHWDSFILGAYLEQTFRIRSGKVRDYAWFTGFLCVPCDVVAGLARVLPSITSQMSLVRCRRAGYRFSTMRTKKLRSFESPRPNVEVMPGNMKRKERWFRRLWMAVMLPWQSMVIAPLFNIVVPHAWRNLLRRTECMFRTPREFDPNVRTSDYSQPVGNKFCPQEGAMARFLRALGETVAVNPDVKIELDVISHSMGGMIVNEIVRTAPELPYRNLVYMAPACSIRHFAESVAPVLADEERTSEVNAWVLTLNPKVESLEGGWDRFYTPIGSVLEWLEGFLTPPNSYLDRFLGKWDNVLSALHIFKDPARQRLHVKGFPYNPNKRVEPWRHVQFNDIETKFWREEYWRGPAVGKGWTSEDRG